MEVVLGLGNDIDKITDLRIFGNFFQQANVVIYLNGKLVAKIDDIGRGAGDTLATLNEFARNQLQSGENVIAISSRHLRRWGSYRGTYMNAEKVGFGVEVVRK